MNKFILLIVVFHLFTSAKMKAQDDHGHDHEIPAVKFSQITDGVEIFAEYPLLVKGETSRFIAHFTNLINYKPISDATAILYYNGQEVDRATKVLRNGIFILNYKPNSATKGQLRAVLRYAGNEYPFTFKHSQVYASAHDAEENAPEELEPDIVFLKEQAWVGEFGVVQAELKPFEDVIHTSGEILPAVDSRISIISHSNGVIKLNNNTVAGKKVQKGQSIAGISGKDLENSREIAYKTTLAEYKDIEARYNIASRLIESQSISKKEFSRIKADYQSAKAKMLTFGDFNSKGEFNPRKVLSIVSPRDGIISVLNVRNGDYVSSGDVIAEVTVGQSFLLKADFPKHESARLPQVIDANFVPEYMSTNDALKVSEMGGVPLYGNKLAAGKSPYIPYYFNLPANAELIPNSFASISVLCKAANDNKSVVIPESALLENEGNYWVYVELEGENYTRQEVLIGSRNGKEVEIKEGIQPGDVVVTKGAYRVKQAASSGEIPEHTH